jgi:uncharacterized cupredoxin-like copper-binding protein
VRLCAVLLLAAVVAAVGLASFAWAGGGSRVIRIGERDFRISAPKTIRAGFVRLRVHNTGPDTHELLMVRVHGRLPLRRDGLTVDEDRLERLHPIVVEGMERGETEEVGVRLAPGRYVLFCNMAGHYLSGMEATVVVR